MTDQPEGIIITISQQMLKEKGVRRWTRSFLEAMANEGWTYWMRQGAMPKRDINYVYLCIGGHIRYRAYFAGTRSGEVELQSSPGIYERMTAKAWILLSGPVEKPHTPVLLKGFRGFRYTTKLF